MASQKRWTWLRDQTVTINPASPWCSGGEFPGLGAFPGEGPMQRSGSDVLVHASPLSPPPTQASVGIPASDRISPVHPMQRSVNHPPFTWVPLCPPIFSKGLLCTKLCARFWWQGNTRPNLCHQNFLSSKGFNACLLRGYWVLCTIFSPEMQK